MTDRPDREQNPKPVRLEYFAANLPRDPRAGRVSFLWMMLGAGWLPFTCGVVSSRAVSQSGVPDVVSVHLHAGAAFMAIGILLSLSCAVGFWRAAKKPAAGVAIASVLLQISSFLCVYGG